MLLYSLIKSGRIIHSSSNSFFRKLALESGKFILQVLLYSAIPHWNSLIKVLYFSTRVFSDIGKRKIARIFKSFRAFSKFCFFLLHLFIFSTFQTKSFPKLGFLFLPEAVYYYLRFVCIDRKKEYIEYMILFQL